MMHLARRILEEKRALVVPLAIALALNLVIYAVAVYPLSLKVAGAEQRARTATLNLLAAQQRAAQARATLTAKERAGQELRRFYSEILPADLATARRITGLRLAQLAQQSDLRYERRTVSPDQERDSRLARLRMTMIVEGEYQDVRRFIYQVETSPEFVVIEDVALVQGEEGGAPLVLTLDVSTYYWTGEDGT
jgi:Tfp pilus assembly protein PilO